MGRPGPAAASWRMRVTAPISAGRAPFARRPPSCEDHWGYCPPFGLGGAGGARVALNGASNRAAGARLGAKSRGWAVGGGGTMEDEMPKTL